MDTGDQDMGRVSAGGKIRLNARIPRLCHVVVAPQASVRTSEPGSMLSHTKGRRLAPEASGIRLRRTRPNPFGSCSSTAMTTISLRSGPRPRAS